LYSLQNEADTQYTAQCSTQRRYAVHSTVNKCGINKSQKQEFFGRDACAVHRGTCCNVL